MTDIDDHRISDFSSTTLVNRARNVANNGMGRNRNAKGDDWKLAKTLAPFQNVMIEGDVPVSAIVGRSASDRWDLGSARGAGTRLNRYPFDYAGTKLDLFTSNLPRHCTRKWLGVDRRVQAAADKRAA